MVLETSYMTPIKKGLVLLNLIVGKAAVLVRSLSLSICFISFICFYLINEVKIIQAKFLCIKRSGNGPNKGC